MVLSGLNCCNVFLLLRLAPTAKFIPKIISNKSDYSGFSINISHDDRHKRHVRLHSSAGMLSSAIRVRHCEFEHEIPLWLGANFRAKICTIMFTNENAISDRILSSFSLSPHLGVAISITVCQRIEIICEAKTCWNMFTRFLRRVHLLFIIYVT